MNREILFRGKRIKTGKWGYGDLIRAIGKTFVGEEEEDIFWMEAEVYPGTVGQFTGLCDKNGVKIFEGDIIESVDDGTVGAREWDAAFGKHHEICWVKQDMQDFFGTVYVGFEIPLCAHSEYMTVIGNIHDNPELLNEEAE